MHPFSCQNTPCPQFRYALARPRHMLYSISTLCWSQVSLCLNKFTFKCCVCANAVWNAPHLCSASSLLAWKLKHVNNTGLLYLKKWVSISVSYFHKNLMDLQRPEGWKCFSVPLIHSRPLLGTALTKCQCITGLTYRGKKHTQFTPADTYYSHQLP